MEVHTTIAEPPSATSQADRLRARLRERPYIRVRDLAEDGISPTTLRRMLQAGEVEQVERGLYWYAAGDLTEHHSQAAVMAKVPDGVLCLLTALRFHEIGTQSPWDVWLAIPRSAHRPTIRSVPVRIFRFSPLCLRAGIEAHVFEGVRFRVTNPARTVADCFKYRNKVGMDVALEALREALRDRKCTGDEIWRASELCRVQRVIWPYLEAMP